MNKSERVFATQIAAGWARPHGDVQTVGNVEPAVLLDRGACFDFETHDGEQFVVLVAQTNDDEDAEEPLDEIASAVFAERLASVPSNRRCRHCDRVLVSDKRYFCDDACAVAYAVSTVEELERDQDDEEDETDGTV